MEKKLLSVVINTKNSELTLARTLRSVRGIADEVVIMDMHSKDNTVEIAKRFGCRIFYHKDVGYVEPARNAALAKARGNWIFLLDADEEAPARFKELLKSLPETSADAFFVPRSNIIFGRAVHSGWWPDFQLRLFKKGHVLWSDELHAVPSVTGTTEYLPVNQDYAIIHHNYDSIDSFIDRGQRYAGIEAQRMSKKKLPITPQESFFSELILRYYGWQGGKDKTHGVFLSYLQGTQKLMEQAKLWELSQFREVAQKPLSHYLAKALRDARYWEAHWQVEKSYGLAKIFWKIRRKLRV